MPDILSALLAASSLAASATPQAVVDGRLAALVQPAGPGCALAVERAGRTVMRRTRGLADLERGAPIALDTVFEAGSVSKQFTAAALAVLAAQGRLSLDDDVRRYVPELPVYAAPITLRMLLNHTSGLRNWGDLVELQGWPEGTRVYKPAYVLSLVARQRGLNFEPGAEYLYSNTNYVLAALVAERVSGMGLTAFMRAALFDRLGMKDTRWREDFAAVTPRRAQAYDRARDGAWRLDMPFGDVFGPGGLLTTVEDLTRWNAVLAAPGPADAPWVRMMTVPGRLNDGTEIRYALGLETETIRGVEVVSHAGSTAGYRTYLARAPSRAVSLALLCNAGDLNTEDLGPELLAPFLPEPATPSGPPPTQAPPLRALEPALLGAYRNPRTDALVQVTAKGGGLSLDGGPPFVERRPGVFLNLAGTRTVTVRDGGLRVTRTANSAVDLVKLTDAEQRRPAPATLVGPYHSEEVEADVSLSLDAQGGLTWTDPSGAVWRTSWLYGDVFDVPDGHWTLAFTRGPSDVVDGLRLSSTRTRGVVFRRRAGAHGALDVASPHGG